ncbi:MAG: hypothetical protein IKY27_00415 [Bacteroidales bacterium]|nr:hypothetical protein [Bacteroidales bacterium]
MLKKGYGPPSAKLPGSVGDIYQDLMSGLIYQCISVDIPAVKQQFIKVSYINSNTTYIWSEIAAEEDDGGCMNLLDYASSVNTLFYKTCFDQEIINVSFGNVTGKYIDSTNTFISMFEEAYGMKKVKIQSSAEFVHNIKASKMFSIQTNAKYDTLEVIDLTGVEQIVISEASQMFNGRSKLNSILGTLNFAQCTSSSKLYATFNGCRSLVEIRFEPGYIMASISFASSQELSAESIQSIVDGLCDLTGGTSQTLTLHSKVVTKLTAEQLAQIETKNWAVG